MVEPISEWMADEIEEDRRIDHAPEYARNPSGSAALKGFRLHLDEAEMVKGLRVALRKEQPCSGIDSEYDVAPALSTSC